MQMELLESFKLNLKLLVLSNDLIINKMINTRVYSTFYLLIFYRVFNNIHSKIVTFISVSIED